MRTEISPKVFIFSAVFHVGVILCIGLSFGPVPRRMPYTQVLFSGAILSPYDILGPRVLKIRGIDSFFSRLVQKTESAVMLKTPPGEGFLSGVPGQKPLCLFTPGERKAEFIKKAAPEAMSFLKKDQSIVFYPVLPSHFLLYFKDRQSAHIKLSFSIAAQGADTAVLVKRKISSGNLEVDLLTMRYISHYLFIQQARFKPNLWHDVQIDLTAGKNDDNH